MYKCSIAECEVTGKDMCCGSCDIKECLNKCDNYNNPTKCIDLKLIKK